MVMHSAHGLGDQVRERARRLAGLGYVVVASDMYGGGVHHTDPEASGRSMMEVFSEPERLRARAVAWYEEVKNRSDVDPQRVAAIGFCFGGMCVLELARSGADVKAVISFHGLLSTSRPAALPAQSTATSRSMPAVKIPMRHPSKSKRCETS